MPGVAQKLPAETSLDIWRRHLLEGNGLLFGQCVTAVGWVGGTVPELTEAQGIVKLSIADVAGAGIAVGAALVGRRPIYVVNYAAEAKELWNLPCPILVRSIAMEGGIGPASSGSHHGMVMRMPGMPVVAPMTPGEWLRAWDWFMGHDEPLYVSEHRRSFPLKDETPPVVNPHADVTLLAISAARLNAADAVRRLAEHGVSADLVPLVWLKPLGVPDAALESLAGTRLGLVIDSDFEIAGPSRSIAYELMHRTRVPIHALGLEDRTAGFAPELDNPTPRADRIVETVLELVGDRTAARGTVRA